MLKQQRMCSPAQIPANHIFPLKRLSPSELSLPSFIYSFVAGWICQFEQAKLWDWGGNVWSKKKGGDGGTDWIEEEATESDKKRLWQSSIWPRLLSERGLPCQISVLTVNSHICAEHRGVSCTMVSWFRIRLDKAIGWMTRTEPLFLPYSLSPFLSPSWTQNEIWDLFFLIKSACLCGKWLSMKTLAKFYLHSCSSWQRGNTFLLAD